MTHDHDLTEHNFYSFCKTKNKTKQRQIALRMSQEFKYSIVLKCQNIRESQTAWRFASWRIRDYCVHLKKKNLSWHLHTFIVSVLFCYHYQRKSDSW